MIVNNGYLGMVRQWQDMFFDERFSQIAPDAQRCPTTRRSRGRTAALGFTAENEEELEAALTEALASRPHLRRRCARRSARALLPDDPGGCGGARRHGRVPEEPAQPVVPVA